ncbi:DNA-binding domain-containing protein [Hyphomicrobium sp.]|uniref:HvfC/BufC N-terminal domain-containing protein n=1 Tax=Hyphomicrobium sp. TaxID=82 RepID=UPI0025C66F0E|nr:DNA-binding domain-containing protein [Hyphomicrobium sp.]MCC7253642.1 putative DNA-binding domain-containing protein [Hyphomicrobium sp.]
MTRPSPSRTSPPTLREIEAQLQAAILTGDDTVLAALADGAHASRDTLLGVYRQAYTARLIEVLMSDYPLLRSYVGDVVFRELAHSFIAAHPSRSQNVRWFGTPFPEFLKEQGSAAKHPALAEIAAIERSVSDAFDCIDAPVLGFDDLAAYPPEEWARLTFSLHPSVTFMPAATNAFHIWKALNEQETPPRGVCLPIPEHVVVWRYGATPKVRLMMEEEAMIGREARRGASFGTLCEMLAIYADPDSAPARAAGYLQAWLTNEMLTSAKVVARNRRAHLARRAAPSSSSA